MAHLRTRVTLIIIGLFCLSPVFAHPNVWEIDWSQPVLIADGTMADLEIDSNDNLQVAYVEVGGSQNILKLAKREGSSWTFEEIATKNRFHSVDLELNIFNTPYVAYLYGATDCEIADRIEQNSWNTEYVGENASDIDLELDSRNRPHILAANLSGIGLQHLYFDKMGWTAKQIDTDIAPGYGVSMALDSDDRPQAAYYKKSSQALKYAAKNDLGNWTTETVESSTSERFLSPSLGVGDEPYLAFLKSSAGNGTRVFFSTRMSDSWLPPNELSSGQLPTLSPSLGLRPIDLVVDSWKSIWVAQASTIQEPALDTYVKSVGVWESVHGGTFGSLDAISSVSIAVDREGTPHVVFSADNAGTESIYYTFGTVESVPHGTDYNSDGVVDEVDLFVVMNRFATP